MELLNELIADVQLSTWVTVGTLTAASVLVIVLAQWRPFRRLLAKGFVRHAGLSSRRAMRFARTLIKSTRRTVVSRTGSS